MRFSERWLREWVNPPLSTAQLAHEVTMAGLEVDAIEPVAGEFSGVVVGEVLAVAPHPDADKLRVCQVNVGESEPLTIVCGAANVAAGMRVPTARIGAVLPGNFKIKKSKLRGQESFGMLCSAKELGLAEQAEGLMPLPSDAPVGQDVREYLQLDDQAIELGLTPNRGDCLSVAGVAREVAALSRLSVSPAPVVPVPAQIEDMLEVRLEAPADCPHYVGRVMRNIDNNAVSPLWMQERLRRSGLRSLGPVVDVTNYVLLELGQPMHAFDLERLSGEAIMVRHAAQGERITLLDERELALAAGSLVIADGAGPQALAGIMGGLASAVGEGTRHIFLESAYFSPTAIAGRARSYGMHTDSSHRFERGVSPALQREAVERATALLLGIVGGEPGPVIEATSAEHLPQRTAVHLRRDRIARVLGVDIAAHEVQDILERLGMVVAETEVGWNVTPPAFRFDIEREEDLLEELARVHGYNALPNTRPRGALTIDPRPEGHVSLARLKHALTDRGYLEAITYSFVEPGVQQLLVPDQDALALANPLSADLSVMRTSLWPGLVQALRHNLNRQQERVRLFESGVKFLPQGADFEEVEVIAGVISGELYPEQWGWPSHAVDFYDLKGDVDALLALTARAGEFRLEPREHPALHPGQSAVLLEGDRAIGWLGRLHPEVERSLDLSQSALVFELELASVQKADVAKFRELSRFPSIRRDLALIVDETVSARQVLDCAKEVAPAIVTNVQLFDMYQGKAIDSGRKSLALSLTLQDVSRTLTDTEVEEAVQRIVAALSDNLGGTLRK